ncbi:MAG: M61 family metallopeptidase [Acidobacteriota bacterium]|nr:M61 family metallopeptidase [Acidobacteriota bacterium]
MLRLRRIALTAALALLVAPIVCAASDAPIQLSVDATQAPMRIIHTTMVMPVTPGPLTLYYPKWIPGEHAPDGPIANLTGLKISSGGKTIPWRRDLVDMFAFHLTIPEGVTSIDVKLDYIEPQSQSGFSAGASATDKLLVLSWNQNLLYPGGRRAQEIIYKPTLQLPEGWKYGTALPVAADSGSEIEFKPVSLNRLVDSPVVAGEYLRVVNLTPPGEPIHHEMDIASDNEASLDISPKQIQDYTNLVAQTWALFGARHYRDYHFLFTLSNHVAHFGLEHHESDDSRTGAAYFSDPNLGLVEGDLLPHEFVHSWNGKFRRPADLSPPYYDEPMKDDLLWVYEGLTNYYGNVLSARSGIWTPQQYREYLAYVGAMLGPGRPGRTWRPLQDTADAAQVLYFAPAEWVNWRRSTDYYREGDLLWLEVNTTIRSLTHGQKSLKDFCHLFYGGPNDGPQLKTYTFDDLVSALNDVAPYDWASFFRKRLESTSPEAPMGGIEAAGWKLVYTNKESQFSKAHEEAFHLIAVPYSIGLILDTDGGVQDSIVGSPAYKAGISSGMRLVAVNGQAFSAHVLRAAIEDTKNSSKPLDLLVENDGYYKTYPVDYHDGERYPHLVPIEGKPDLLDAISKPLPVNE